MTYDEAADYLKTAGKKGSILGLERISTALAALGDPQDKCKTVHVAGTNGKGSVCSMVAGILIRAGYNVGMYTSPYMKDIHDCIRVNGKVIEKSDFASCIEKVESIAKDELTQYEILTCAAFLWFKKCDCDFSVIEVGLGGLLDSTNVISKPELEILTAIDHDHMKELGSTIEEIAGAKAGIIKSDTDVCVYCGYGIDEDTYDRTLRVIKKVCSDKNARAHISYECDVYVNSSDISGSIFSYKTYKDIHIRLIGEHQIYNCALAIDAIEVLGKKYNIPFESVYSGIVDINWPARFEIINRDEENDISVIYDGAHNPNGMRMCVNTVKKCFPDKKVILVISMMADKDTDKMLDIVLPISSKAITVRASNKRSMDDGMLADLIRSKGVPAIAARTPESGVRQALSEAEKGTVICAIGTLYMYKDLLRHFR